MADRDDPTAAELAAAFARLEKTTARVRRHEDAAEAEREVAAKEAVEALRLGLAAGKKRIRSEVLKRSPFSHTTLRSIADEAGIPPDERYVRTTKAAESRAPQPIPASAAREEVAVEERSRAERIKSLDRAGAARLVERAANGTDDGWVERATAGKRFAFEVDRFRFLVGVALDEGLLKDSDLPD